MTIEAMMVLFSPFSWFTDVNKGPSGWIIYTTRKLESHELPTLTVKYEVRPLC